MGHARTLTRTLSAVGLTLTCLTAAPTAAHAAATDGTLAIDVDVPTGGTALLEVRNATGTSVVRSLVVAQDSIVKVLAPAGTYKILPRQVLVGGERYIGKAQPLTALVKAGQTRTVDVDYVRSLGVQHLRVTGLSATSVTVDWDVTSGADTTVWRLEGDKAPTKQGQGTQVTLTDSSLFTDSGLTPGRVYSYSVFARPGDGAFGRDDVDPVSLTVSTEDNDPTTPSFVLSPGTRILATGEFTPSAGQDNLVLDLAPGVTTPTPGTVLSVPPSATLPGGYLGEVVSVSADGRRVVLVAAPLAAAFDLYKLEISDIAALPAPEYFPSSPKPMMQSSAQTKALAAVPYQCEGSSQVTIDPDLSQSHAGHADVTVDKYQIKYLPDVPYQVNYDFGYTTTLKATVDVESSDAATCGLDLPRFFKNLTYYPVPIAVDVEPKAELSLFGKLSVQNVGAAVTTGFSTSGKLPLTGLPSVDGDLIFDITPTQPVASAEVGLNLLVDGSVTFGPGVGTSDVGVVVGVSGNFSPLDATASVVTVAKNGTTETCAKFEAKYKAGMSAALKAWVPGYSTDYKVPIDPLQGEWDYPGSPYFWPTDCTDSGTPTNDVVGDGVTVIGDDITGQQEQFGKVGGFVPGQGTWVLSTGRISDVVGQPSIFASTGLGGDGNAALSGLSGFATYDAASYKVTLVPNEDTLVVRYAFGSEEYPEYVGSSFNDVMGVFVNGVNCALVPGTSTPVAINSVNQNINSQYYVDNTSGAAGYGTTMDGLTVPLECRIPVTPGQQVTVEIAVADASDSIYDSAIALLDGGIYSE